LPNQTNDIFGTAVPNMSLVFKQNQLERDTGRSAGWWRHCSPLLFPFKNPSVAYGDIGIVVRLIDGTI